VLAALALVGAGLWVPGVAWGAPRADGGPGAPPHPGARHGVHAAAAPDFARAAPRRPAAPAAARPARPSPHTPPGQTRVGARTAPGPAHPHVAPATPGPAHPHGAPPAPGPAHLHGAPPAPPPAPARAILTLATLPPYYLPPPTGTPSAVPAQPPAGGTERAVPPERILEPMVEAGGPWKGPSLKAASGLTIPIAFGFAVGLFLVLQALIDRRDPKVARAPERSRDDTVGFG